jgi:hypothetical protein
MNCLFRYISPFLLSFVLIASCNRTESPTGPEKIPSHAIQFDGVDDYASIMDDEYFDFDTTFSVEAWVKPISLERNGSNIGKFLEGLRLPNVA